MLWLHQTLSSLVTATIAGVILMYISAVSEEGGSQVLKTAYLFEPYSLHVDLCLVVTNDHDSAMLVLFFVILELFVVSFLKSLQVHWI